MSTQNNTIVSEEVIIPVQENDLKDALNIVELEERFEMTAAAADAMKCIYSDSAVA